MSGQDPVIEIKNLERIYRMGEHEVRALRGIDLSIHEGEFVAIVGPSGSGKSTLMYILGCLDKPTSGHYHLTGKDASQLSDAELSQLRNRSIGFVFQAYHLLPALDVVQNVALGLTYSGSAVEDRRPLATALAEGTGLKGRLHHKATELSGGQMQRVAIARALSVQPAIILADEPTGNLDSHTGADIMAVFHRLHEQGHTIVLVTHDPEVAKQADRIVTIVDGEIRSDVINDEKVGGSTQLADKQEKPTEDETQDGKQQSGAVAGGSSIHLLNKALESFDSKKRGAGRIRWLDIFRMAITEGLIAHKLRTALTMLGIVFGIAAVIAMTAITEGGREQQLEQIRQIGLNNIQIRDRGLEGPALVRARRLHPDGVMLEDMHEIEDHVEGIVASSAWRTIKAELRHKDALIEDAGILGVTGAFESVVNYHVASGRFIDKRDEERYARVCVCGPQIISELGISGDPLGQVVLVGDQPCVIVGVMEEKNFIGNKLGDVTIENRNRQIYLPYATVSKYFRRVQRSSLLDGISLRMASDHGLVEKAELIQLIVADGHRGADDFTVSVPIEKLKQAQQTREVFNLIITVIAGISLLVGGIGIMNIMLATVTERTREIGIRRAIGASRRDVMSQFLTEAVLIAGCGGACGIACGIAGALIVESGFGFAVAFNSLIISIAAGVSVSVGVAFGLYPAWLAAHKDPVEALRS